MKTVVGGAGNSNRASRSDDIKGRQKEGSWLLSL